MNDSNNQEQNQGQNRAQNQEQNKAQNQTQNQTQNTGSQLEAGNHNTLMAILAYIGPLVIVSFLVSKNDSFVKFHIKQGSVLLGIEVFVWILGMVIYPFWMIVPFINLATLVLSIIGIINVVQKKEKEIPLVGSLSKYVNI